MQYNWKNQLLGREVLADIKRQKKPAPDHERAELERQVESLRRDILEWQLEHDILKKANELVKREWASPRNSRATQRRGGRPFPAGMDPDAFASFLSVRAKRPTRMYTACQMGKYRSAPAAPISKVRIVVRRVSR